jgi:hypothetical protein
VRHHIAVREPCRLQFATSIQRRLIKECADAVSAFWPNVMTDRECTSGASSTTPATA